jgi:hypothetical protein
MCIPFRQRDPKTRRMRFIGNFSLVAAILVWIILRPSGGLARDWIDGLSGLLFGISIGVNLCAFRCARHAGTAEPK